MFFCSFCNAIRRRNSPVLDVPEAIVFTRCCDWGWCILSARRSGVCGQTSIYNAKPFMQLRNRHFRLCVIRLSRRTIFFKLHQGDQSVRPLILLLNVCQKRFVFIFCFFYCSFQLTFFFQRKFRFFLFTFNLQHWFFIMFWFIRI